MSILQDHCVLVVEDEFYLAKDVQQTLKSAGASIMGPFARKAEVLSALEQERPHCAIIDVNLGGGVNFDLADRLRERGVPFLFFTGYDREVIPPRFADVMRLEKPVDTVHLVRAVEAVCTGASSGS
jgi:FixJ family two-component response regulator